MSYSETTNSEQSENAGKYLLKEGMSENRDKLDEKFKKESGCLGPPAVKYIIINEACERYSYYALRSILFAYLTEKLMYDKSTATIIMSATTAVGFISPLFGAYIADSCWGKFKTIFVFSIFYVISGAVLALSAVSFIPGLAMIGLFGIALGAGGIKACVSSFGGDQFASNDKDGVERFFASFYTAINIAALISFAIEPVIRSKFSYLVAFCLPVGFLSLALVVFVCAKDKYRSLPPSGNILSDIWPSAKYVLCAGRNRVDKFEQSIMRHGIEETRMAEALTIVLPVLCFVPMFWTLSDLQSSQWVAQAGQMNLYNLEKEQIGVLNTICVVCLVPSLNAWIYPAFRSCGFKVDYYQRIFVGLLITIIASLCTTFVEAAVENSPKGTISIFAQVPQYFFISLGESLISVTALEFCYVQSPPQMKSLMTSLALLTTAIGNLTTVFVFSITKQIVGIKMVHTFILFTLLIILNTILFKCCIRKKEKYAFDEYIYESAGQSTRTDYSQSVSAIDTNDDVHQELIPKTVY